MNKGWTDSADYVNAFARRYSYSRVLAELRKLRTTDVLVVGDAVIDEYRYYQALGKSAKGPTLAVRHLYTERFAGGALLVANQIAAFCQNVTLITLVGPDVADDKSIRDNMNRRTRHLFVRHPGRTTTKVRIIDEASFTKLLEIYEVLDTGGSDYDELLCDILAKEAQGRDLIVVADFGHGALSDEAIETICRQETFLAVSTQANAANYGFHTISKYRRADFVCLTEREIRLDAREPTEDITTLTKRVFVRMGCKSIVVTRGRDGSVIFDANNVFAEVPSLAQQVSDTLGAGDAVFSMTALCAARQMPADLTGFLGSAIAAEAVAQVGNNAVSGEALCRRLKTLLDAGHQRASA